ncbi:MAG: hypothetical protein A2142_07345 [candidate division Zixibacteria bacterium RBG_16_48_11]|nr:MAG: hypothetical protein A2142_07345 [candidate division Zixibacteria bacterium RBG_16_48_11]
MNKTKYPSNLPNKPLVEAIIELKWGIETEPDHGYPLIVGRLYEKIMKEFPHIEDLPINVIPPDLSVHIVRHRFRKAENRWPLVQIGPGILTLNETVEYNWESFLQTANKVFPLLFDLHPNAQNLKITSLMLRYINGIPADYVSSNILKILNDKLHVNISLPTKLSEGFPLENKPMGLLLQSGVAATKPRGVSITRFTSGKLKEKPAIIWELQFVSTEVFSSNLKDIFNSWLVDAHTIIEHWFFVLSEGELLKEFLRENV